VTDFYTEEEGSRQIHISYDFSWPGGGNLVSAAERLNGTYCATAMFSWGTAKNITDRYTEENTMSTDCTPVLGEACVKAILTWSAKGDDGASQGCWDRLWSQYPECADTFGIEEYSPYGTHRLILQTYDLMSQYTKSGEPFHVITAGGGNDGSNNDASLPGLYESAINMLQVVLLRPPLWLPNETWYPTLNCMRVNSTKEVVDVGSGGGHGGGSEEAPGSSEGNKGDGNSAASRVSTGLWALMGSLAVALL
jgi:hypothetical protein